MKKQMVLIGLIVVLISVGLSGCTQQNNTSSDESNIQSTPPTTESLESILAKTDTIESMYYEIAASINMSEYGTQTATIQIWQKPPYLKEQITGINAGVTTTIEVIHRPEGNYTYDVVQGKYVQASDVTSFAPWLQYFDSELLQDLLNKQIVTNLETMIIDGKKATVFDYSLSIQGMNITIKMWIWNERGVPLKACIDMDMTEMAMMIDFTFSNYSFLDIPDSTFSVS
jgi:outer membrane lipoprotein-sorting protein